MRRNACLGPLPHGVARRPCEIRPSESEIDVIENADLADYEDRYEYVFSGWA